jgi:hypothetical protein
VTFDEFVRSVIHSHETQTIGDASVLPQHDHCDLSHTHYDFIGHMETLHEDTHFLVQALHLPVNYTAPDTKTIMEESAAAAFRNATQLAGCADSVDIGRRLWRAWQIQGLVSIQSNFHFDTNHISNTTDLQKAILASALSSSTSNTATQKSEALAEAFSTVPVVDRVKLKKIFSLDFKMFGYSPKPDSVFLVMARNANLKYFGPL